MFPWHMLDFVLAGISSNVDESKVHVDESKAK